MSRILLALVLGIPCFISCTTYDESGDSKSVRLIIIGGIGAGKSTTGNVILGREEFDANTKSGRVTLEPATESTFRLDRKVVVVDTPGFDASNRSLNDHILTQIMSHSSLAYDAIILVLRIQEYEFNEEMVHFLQDTLHNDVFEHLIIIFSNIAALEKNDEKLEENLADYPESSLLKKLILRINQRYIGLQHYSKINKEDTAEITRQILNLVDNLPKLPICLCLNKCSMELQATGKGDDSLSNDDKKLTDIEMKLEELDCIQKYCLYTLFTLCGLIILIFLMFVYNMNQLQKSLSKHKTE